MAHVYFIKFLGLGFLEKAFAVFTLLRVCIIKFTKKKFKFVFCKPSIKTGNETDSLYDYPNQSPQNSFDLFS